MKTYSSLAVVLPCLLQAWVSLVSHSKHILNKHAGDETVANVQRIESELARLETIIAQSRRKNYKSRKQCYKQ